LSDGWWGCIRRGGWWPCWVVSCWQETWHVCARGFGLLLKTGHVGGKANGETLGTRHRVCLPPYCELRDRHRSA
jgi:hypothetical protein